MTEGKGPREHLYGRRRPLVLACGLVASLGGCTLITDSFLTNDFSGDPFPIQVETASGAIVVGVRQAADRDREVVLDLLSPITLTDPGLSALPSVTYVDLTLLGQSGTGLDRPRAKFVEAQLVSLHPCENECPPDAPDTCKPEQCQVGVPGAPRPFTGILGADVLAGDAVRLRLADNQMFILPDVGGDDRNRSLACEAVFSSPYRGGGTLVIGGTELPFGNRRITLQACLGPDVAPDPDPVLDMMSGPAPNPTTFRQHGADALFVVSTSIGISILDVSAYERHRRAHPELTFAEFETLPEDAVYLPSGLVRGRRATIDRLALIAASTSNGISPCRQVYAHRLLTTFKLTNALCLRNPEGNALVDCPCKDESAFCPVPAILELPDRIDFLVVPDTDPTLQALRTELRPDQPEVDGLLGTNVLRGAEIDVDYPHDRLIARCPNGTCTARPQLSKVEDLCQVKRCFTGTQPHNGCDGKLLPDPILPKQ